MSGGIPERRPEHRTPEHRTPAQVRVGAIHTHDLRGLTAEESTEAMRNIERLILGQPPQQQESMT